MHHRIKIDKAFFEAIEDGIKLFELRENDRDYRIGDTAELTETKYTAAEMYRGAPCEFTGREIAVVITFVLLGNKGSMLREDACIFSFHVLGDTTLGAMTREVNRWLDPIREKAKIDRAFLKFTTYTENERGNHVIRCKKGNWGVEAPTEKEALSEARHYFRQYYLDGEYNE